MSKEYKIVRLGDCATFINGKAFKPSDWVDDGVPIIRIQNLTGSSIEVNYFNGNIEDKYKITDGDILISWSASLGVFIWNRGNAVLNQHIFKVQFDKLNFDKSYFFYMIQDALDTMSTQVHGATMKHITKSNFDNISVLYPAIAKQQEIAAVLDKASELVEKRKAQLAELDALAESIFYDMFGDPVTNEKCWNVSLVSDIASVKIGPFGSLLHVEDYVSGGVPLVNPVHMRNLRIEPDNNLTVSVEKYKELSSYILKPMDIIFGRRGDIGRCALVTENENGYICGTGSLFIRFTEPINPQYSICTLSHQSIAKYLIDRAKGATMLNINCKIVENIPLIQPPLQLQQQFAERIEKIEQQKQKVKAALKESEDLFQRLMQDMFNPKLHK